MTQPTTGEIWEARQGGFWTLLPPCSVRVLPRVLYPEPASHVWLVRHWPHAIVEWVDLPLPFARGQPPRVLRARGAQYDVQLPLLAFLDLLPSYPPRDGALLLQMARPVPDTLDYFRIADSPNRHRILRQSGWLLTFDLPHSGEYAAVWSWDRAHLERVLADPVIASGDLP